MAFPSIILNVKFLSHNLQRLEFLQSYYIMNCAECLSLFENFSYIFLFFVFRNKKALRELPKDQIVNSLYNCFERKKSSRLGQRISYFFELITRVSRSSADALFLL